MILGSPLSDDVQSELRAGPGGDNPSVREQFHLLLREYAIFFYFFPLQKIIKDQKIWFELGIRKEKEARTLNIDWVINIKYQN